MFGTTPDDEKAINALVAIINDVAPGWELHGFKGSLLHTAVLVKGDKQKEVTLWDGRSGRFRLDMIADGNSLETDSIRNHILESLRE